MSFGGFAFEKFVAFSMSRNVRKRLLKEENMPKIFFQWKKIAL